MPTGEGRPASFWERVPWRRWLGGLAAALTLALAVGAFALPAQTQIVWTQFAIPAYLYTCIGLAAVAICELREARGQRILMLVVLLALAPLGVLGFAAGGVGPLLVLATHVGFLIGWMAWPRRTAWTLLWLVEALAWVAVAVAQGRLP